MLNTTVKQLATIMLIFIYVLPIKMTTRAMETIKSDDDDDIDGQLIGDVKEVITNRDKTLKDGIQFYNGNIASGGGIAIAAGAAAAISSNPADILNIRHERSKHRHSSEKEQQQHVLRTVFNTQQQQQPHIIIDGNIAAGSVSVATAITLHDNDDDTHLSSSRQQKKEKFSQNFHIFDSNSDDDDDDNENDGDDDNDNDDDDNDDAAEYTVSYPVATAITKTDAGNNITNHLNNVNDLIIHQSKNTIDSSISSSNRNIYRGTSNIYTIFKPTVATHHLIPSVIPPPLSTTSSSSSAALKAVTHKIRKLHKKKIVESLRQLNSDKFNTNGGAGTGHHRSLLEAEQRQQQLQLLKTKIPQEQIHHDVEQQPKTVAVVNENGNTNLGNEGNTISDTDDEDDGQDESDVKTIKVYDTKGSMSVQDMNDILNEDTEEEEEDDENEDTSIVEDDEDEDVEELSDVLYQNDADDGDSDTNDDDDENEIFATTVNSLRKTNNFNQNFTSDKLNEIDNDSDSDSELENVLTKTLPIHNIKPLQNPSNHQKESKLSETTIQKSKNSSLINTENSKFNNSEDYYPLSSTDSTDSPYDFLLQSENHSLEPLLSASTSLGGISFDHHQSSLYDKEEINFNDSSDLLDDSSSSKDLIMDDAVIDNVHANGFPLSDSETDAETTLTFDVEAEDEPNRFLEGVIDAANSDEIYDWDEISRSNRRNLMRGRDVVTKFLQIVETQHLHGSNCEAGTSLNLGEGVVDRYAQDRFRIEAEVAVNRANMLTRIFKMTSAAAQADVNLLHASVLSMVEFDDDIFAAGNCFDWNEHPSQPGLFCPFAYRLPPPNLGAILAKDLAMEYHYLGNTSEWFFQARKNAEKVIARNEQYLKAFHLYSNKTDERIEDDTLAVKYEDGRWSKPYYDCGGGNIWMLTYTVPFFGYENSTYHFKGTSGIDIDLRRVDIDQCPQRNIPGSTKPLNIFAGTDKCKQRTTMCEAIQGLGFRRGSYKCVCRKGYYFPDTTSTHKYFNGSLLEEEYEKLMLGNNSTYNTVNEYECLPCAEGCDSCEDASPCIAALNWPMRTSIVVLACIIIGLLPPAAWFTFRYQQVKVVRAASPALLRVIALGAFFIYCTNIVMYPNPNLYTCTARIWLREIGFSLTYGALMLKTWRISVIFRVRSAKAVKITDAALLKRLGCICGAIGTCLLVRTLVSPPDVVVGRTADDLKAFLCKTDWWDYTFTSMEVVFLAWGVRLCIMVRKAPSEFNESRFISMAIYNEFLLTCFLNVSMLFLQSPANPDLLYIIFFCHTQLTITLLLALIFGSKVYIVLRSGKSHQENIGMAAKQSGAKFNFRPQVRTFANPSSVTTSTVPIAATTSAENKLSDQEALEEIRQLSMQLQRIQEMAPPKGVAVMTISSLLDGLKTPGSMVMVAAAASQLGGAAGGASGGGNQLTIRPQKPESLPLLSLNSEMQKYQQLQIPHKTTTTTATTLSTNNNVAAIKTMSNIKQPSTQVTVTKSTPTKVNASSVVAAAAKWEEKSINTELVGNCIGEEEFKQQQQQQQQHHIICKRCYDKCKTQQHMMQHSSNNNHSTASSANSPAKLNKCQILGSPQQEGSISFKNIKLDCMCSQSDDLDQLSEQHEHQTPIRRITKRTAATNTPPRTARKRGTAKAAAATSAAAAATSHRGDLKAKSLASLSYDVDDKKLTTSATDIPKPISYLSQQQICDNCKNKFKTKEPSASSKAGATTATTNKQQQHRKLSKLSKKCNKLLTDIENSKQTKPTTTTKKSSKITKTIELTATLEKCKKCDDETQNSTDDIIFYTTTDTSDNDDDDDDDDDDDADCDDDDDDSDSDSEDDMVCNENPNKDDDLSSSLSQSKSESKVPFKLDSSNTTIEFKCISLSLGNITTTNTLSSSTQPESIKSKNALLDKTAITRSNVVVDPTVGATAAATATSSTSTAALQQQQSQQSNGSNGKSKRPDKLVLNLNDRSKFTKEVSV